MGSSSKVECSLVHIVGRGQGQGEEELWLIWIFQVIEIESTPKQQIQIPNILVSCLYYVIEENLPY